MTRLSHQDGMTVLFTTHNPNHALAIADEVLLMLGATTFASGPAASVLTEENLQALYGVELKLLLFEHAGRRQKAFVPLLS